MHRMVFYIVYQIRRENWWSWLRNFAWHRIQRCFANF